MNKLNTSPMNFVDLMNQAQTTRTWNGALSHAASGSVLVDLYYRAVRVPGTGKGFQHGEYVPKQFLSYFAKAWMFNPEAALRILFHIRDAREGKGERAMFYAGMEWLAKTNLELFRRALALIPEYGAWKDLLELAVLVNKPVVTDEVVRLFAEALQGSNPLAAKWAPSEGKRLDRALGFVERICKATGWSRKTYRETLVALRQVVETQMSAQEWWSIEYAKVPSKAMLTYNKAFERHAPGMFKGYLEQVEKGEAKINAATLMAHEIVVKWFANSLGYAEEMQWKALVEQYRASLKHTLCVVDVSGSMHSGAGRVKPIHVSLGLGLLAANCLEGVFAGAFVTFSAKPTLQRLDLKAKLATQLQAMNTAEWGMNTNIQAVFRLILDTALANKLPQRQLPQRVLIFSDMQFDQATSNNGATNFERAKADFARAGYKLPELIFWNVNGATADFPVQMHSSGAVLISGWNQTLFKALAENRIVDPVQMVLDIISKPRYDAVGALIS